MSATSWQRRRQWKRRIGFWASVLAVCLLGAAAAVGVRMLLTSVGSVKYTRYEPVDVPPQTVSPRHGREREELERRERAMTEGKEK
jgi:type VI protein secretion system component VasK